MPKRELLFSVTKNELRIDTFRSGGKGGQHQNTRDSGVRIVHLASGAVGESREERSQLQNKKKAFTRMANSPQFKKWCKLEAARKLGKVEELEKFVDEWMRPENLKIEYLKPGER